MILIDSFMIFKDLLMTTRFNLPLDNVLEIASIMLRHFKDKL